METIEKALENISHHIVNVDQHRPIPFTAFLEMTVAQPETMIRNVFQVFHDLMKTYVGEGVDEYPDDPESIKFVNYDCSKLFVEGSDNPFFADRLFANRLIKHVEALRLGAQQNKIYIFDGPHGCGKSTFLNNLLRKFEEYANTDNGLRYETVWRITPNQLNEAPTNETVAILERLLQLQKEPNQEQYEALRSRSKETAASENYIELPCPSHDNPLLMIPKRHRRDFFDDLFANDEFKWTLFTDKAFEWLFRDKPCTICSSLFISLMRQLRDPRRVLDMIYARPYNFNRRLGRGISVFNPGDRPSKEVILSNEMLQRRVNTLFRDSNRVHYLFSRYAKTNNGIYALMDIKSHNIERLIELHNIISEGVHKVEDIEENVNSLFLALMNPEDKKNIQNFQSFGDRIVYINIPYVLDLQTEVEIYRNTFGRHIEDSFLPRVLHNFARVIIASRMNIRSEALLEWIREPDKYTSYCDKNLQLLKMEIYTGHIPVWLTEEDRKRLTAKRRRRIIGESETEGKHGISGRDSLKIFNDFYSSYAKSGKYIDMGMLCKFFHSRKELKASIPDGFLDSLLQLYDYSILQEVKESLYYYNEEQIATEIQNYIFAVNFELGAVETCTYTGERLEITDEYLSAFEKRVLGNDSSRDERMDLRQGVQKEYASKTLTQEIMVEDKPLTATELFDTLHERYVHNLKEKVLDPFLDNENFRRAIKDFGKEDFKTYDKKIRDDVTYLMENLGRKYRYNESGAQAICMYVIDNDLPQRFNLN
ncbi:MAG: serine protein kinase PrkA [Desulfosarcinaceae bacterium]|nr:serine protein kinase PrkA [Desulfosarcinaceae bacterium]